MRKLATRSGWLKCPIVSISGVDGCGKTTIINSLRDALSEAGWDSRYIWLRYNHYLTKIALAIGRFTGLTHYDTVGGVRVGYHEFHRSRLLSYLFIWLTYVDTLLTSVVTVYIPAALSSRTVILCDRWIPDILIDLEIDTRINLGSGSFFHRLFTAIIPSHGMCFIIRRQESDVLTARLENSIDRNFTKRLSLYERHARERIARLIENDGPVQETVQTILENMDLHVRDLSA